MASKKRSREKNKPVKKQPSLQPKSQNIEPITQHAETNSSILTAKQDPGSLTSGELAHLQGSIGNRSVGRLLDETAFSSGSREVAQQKLEQKVSGLPVPRVELRLKQTEAANGAPYQNRAGLSLGNHLPYIPNRQLLQMDEEKTGDDVHPSIAAKIDRSIIKYFRKKKDIEALRSLLFMVEDGYEFKLKNGKADIIDPEGQIEDGDIPLSDLGIIASHRRVRAWMSERAPVAYGNKMMYRLDKVKKQELSRSLPAWPLTEILEVEANWMDYIEKWGGKEQRELVANALAAELAKRRKAGETSLKDSKQQRRALSVMKQLDDLENLAAKTKYDVQAGVVRIFKRFLNYKNALTTGLVKSLFSPDSSDGQGVFNAVQSNLLSTALELGLSLSQPWALAAGIAVDVSLGSLSDAAGRAAARRAVAEFNRIYGAAGGEADEQLLGMATTLTKLTFDAAYQAGFMAGTKFQAARDARVTNREWKQIKNSLKGSEQVLNLLNAGIAAGDNLAARAVAEISTRFARIESKATKRDYQKGALTPRTHRTRLTWGTHKALFKAGAIPPPGRPYFKLVGYQPTSLSTKKSGYFGFVLVGWASTEREAKALDTTAAEARAQEAFKAKGLGYLSVDKLTHVDKAAQQPADKSRGGDELFPGAAYSEFTPPPA